MAAIRGMETLKGINHLISEPLESRKCKSMSELLCKTGIYVGNAQLIANTPFNLQASDNRREYSQRRHLNDGDHCFGLCMQYTIIDIIVHKIPSHHHITLRKVFLTC